MKRPSSTQRRRVAGMVLFSIVAAFVAVASACSNQGEGERCEVDNHDDDCATEDGLHCYPAAQLTNSSSDRCCPTDRSKAVNPVCKTAVAGGGGTSTPADTGPAPTPDASKSDAADASDAAEAAADAADDGSDQ